MSRVLVTGGSGFIGSNLVEALIAQGDEVTLWDIREPKNEKAIFEQRDILEKETYPSQGFDIIFHLAAESRIAPSFENPYLTCHTNAQGTLNIAEFAYRNGSRMVYAGSSSFYHDLYANPYTFSKWAGEETCKLYSRVFGVSTAIARFFNVYGPGHVQDGPYGTVVGIFERQKKQGLPLTVTGDGSKRRDFVHVYDIVDGLIAMSKDSWSGDIFNLGSGVNYSILEVAQMFRPQSIHFIDARPGEAQETLADIQDTTYRLGWIPKHKLPDYIQFFI